METYFKSSLSDFRVTFTLIDQCQDPSGRRNITYTVKPNIVNENKVNLFQRIHNLSRFYQFYEHRVFCRLCQEEFNDTLIYNRNALLNACLICFIGFSRQANCRTKCQLWSD